MERVSKKSYFRKIVDAVFDRQENITPKEVNHSKFHDVNAFINSTGTFGRVVFAGSFDGEKNLGELGPLKYQLMDYYALSLRSWTAFTESTEGRILMNKFATWVVGVGLKLQCEPAKDVIGNGFDSKSFCKMTEARWKVYADSKIADYSMRESLNKLQHTAFKNSIISGDVLVILRFVDGYVNVQLVDAFHLRSPILGSEWFPMHADNGNRIINGVEIDDRGRHVAYYVVKPFDSLNPLNIIDVERVPAIGKKSGMVQAFMVYGDKMRIDNHRGIPLLTTVLEKLKTMDRYEQATLGSAEEQAKVAYQTVHETGATGEDPFAKQIATAWDLDGLQEDYAVTMDGEKLTAKVQATTNKQSINLPPGAEIKTLKSNESQLYFGDFIGKNIDIVCACVEIPPNVAMSKYDSNYSASRAAIKDWEHILHVKRKFFSDQFLRPIFNFWLYVEILQNNISAAGYLVAKMKQDYMMIESFQQCRWIGAPVANIDPEKEAKAERIKLGNTADSIPLTTVEAATENLNGGDVSHNMEQYADELEESKSLGIKPEEGVKTNVNISE